MGQYIKTKGKVLVGTAVLFGGMALAQASVIPNLDVSIFGSGASSGTAAGDAPDLASTPDSHNASKLRYLTGILKDSRTGLSVKDEIRLAEVILDESLAHDLDPLLVMAVIKTESTFYNWAKSHKGAMGLMQIMPETGKWVAGELGLEWDGDRTLYDPCLNVRLGVRYFSVLRDRYDEETHLALAAYNAGPTRLSRVIKRGGKPPKVYADKVLANYKAFQEKASLN